MFAEATIKAVKVLFIMAFVIALFLMLACEPETERKIQQSLEPRPYPTATTCPYDPMHPCP